MNSTKQNTENLKREAFQKFLEDTEKYMEDKKRNWQHLTIIAATILGFSLGISNILDEKVSIFLLITWVLQILTILIGISLLVLEAESRYYRKIIGMDAYLEIIGNITDKKKTQEIFSNFVKEIYGQKKEKKYKKDYTSGLIKIFRKLKLFFILL